MVCPPPPPFLAERRRDVCTYGYVHANFDGFRNQELRGYVAAENRVVYMNVYRIYASVLTILFLSSPQ